MTEPEAHLCTGCGLVPTLASHRLCAWCWTERQIAIDDDEQADQRQASSVVPRLHDADRPGVERP